MWRRMNAWKIMVVVGKIKHLFEYIDLLLRIHFEDEFVNVSWLMACNSKEMDTITVKDIYCVDADGALFDTALLSAVAAFSHCKSFSHFHQIFPSRQAVTALVPIGLYTVCLTNCVTSGTSFKDYIQRCLPSVETLEETHLRSSSGFCTVGCATVTCSRLSSKGRMPATAREVADCINTCVERYVMKN
ncbi:hypothetical protein J1N35_003522 [Gossypium stocksii]|uniref:Uncharacterized protein n=1 Tax=Gossypium stocksii TaxID=47602 RepID=A0A9D4AF78_9ROSI|nr:hypothetical protein J1N35_003522 [Gossypium stocksii]